MGRPSRARTLAGVPHRGRWNIITNLSTNKIARRTDGYKYRRQKTPAAPQYGIKLQEFYDVGIYFYPNVAI